MNKIEFDLNGKSGIYQLKNLINGKTYIGSSSNIYDRLHEHVHNMKYNRGHNAHLQAAWNKYGEENFEYSVLEFCDPEIRLDREQYFIDTIKPEYNLCFNVIGNLNRIVSKETRKKISDTLKRRYRNNEIKTYRQEHAWVHCWIYNINTNELVKECNCIAEADRFLNCKAHSKNDLFSHLIHKKYFVLTENILDPVKRFNYALEKYKTCRSQKGKYLIAESDGKLEYFFDIKECLKKYKFSIKKFMKYTYTKDIPLVINNTLLYYSNVFIPIDSAVYYKEFNRLLLGNIGEGPEKDNTEINLEIKESKSSYSVGDEPEKNIILPRVSDIPTEISG